MKIKDLIKILKTGPQSADVYIDAPAEGLFRMESVRIGKKTEKLSAGIDPTKVILIISDEPKA